VRRILFSVLANTARKYIYAITVKSSFRIRGGLLIALLGCFAFFAASELAAQDSLDGFPPYQAYQGGKFDTVNVQKLTYGFAVPVASVPGRGLNLALALHYSSSIWRLVQVPPGVGSSGWGWRLETGYGSPGWSLGQVIPFVHYTVQSHPCDAGQFSYDRVDNFRISEPDGTTHTFAGFSIIADSPGTTKPSCPANTTGAVTAQGSDGWLLQMTLSGSLLIGQITGPVIAISPSGIQSQSSHSDYATSPSVIALQTGTIKDVNGNSIRGTANGSNEVDWTDTLGRMVLKIIKNTANTLAQYEVLNTSGTYTTTTVGAEIATIKTDFACSQGHSEGNYSGILPTLITLPNGQQYTFTYESTPGNSFATTGRLQSVTLPTGGSVQYTYPGPNDGVTCTPEASPSSNANQKPDQTNSLSRTIGNGSKTLSQTYSWVRQSGSTVQSTLVTSATPADSHVSSKRVVTLNNLVTTDQQFDNAGTTVLRTYVTTLSSQGTPVSTVNILEDSQTESETDYTWHLTGLPLTQTDYDFGLGSHGPLIRTTNWVYLPGSAYTAKNILDRVTDKTVSDSTGKIVSRTHTDFDQNAFTTCPTGVLGHDDTVLCSDLARGNPTTLTRYSDAATPAGPIVQHSSYDWFGNLRQADNDSCTQTTLNFSATTEYAFPDSVVCGPSGGPSLTTRYTYDFNTGLVLSQKDANGQMTSFQYSDSLNRLTGVQYPDGGSTGYSYSDSSRVVNMTRAIGNGVSSLTTKVTYDTLGQSVQAQVTSDPEGIVSTDTTYDALGRVATVSNPYRSTNDTTYGITTSVYDSLDRTTLVIPPDGSVTTNNVSTVYSRNTITATDQAGKTRKSVVDVLGRLTQVLEDPGTSPHLNYETDYTYDVLDNLLTVNQKGGSTNSANWRTRTFVYDSLSRLTSATNPESGTSTYKYDSDTTCPSPNSFPTLRVSEVDARVIRTCMTYDALSRMTQKNYSDGTTPTATYNYDQSAPWGWNLSNYIGRLTTAGTSGTAPTANLYNYDPMGRVLIREQCQPSNCSAAPSLFAAYTYNLIGAATSLQFGEGGVWSETISYAYDAAGRPTTVTSSLVDAQHPATLYTVDPSIGYFPNGALRKGTVANGLTESAMYNNRLQPCRLEINSTAASFTQCTGNVPSGNVLDFTYGYNSGTSNNGNIATWSSVGNQTFTRSYVYDPLNRISTLSDTASAQICKGLSWTIDAWGNRTDQNVTAGSCGIFHATIGANNRFGSPYQYDAAGNMTYDGTHSYTYDAENRITKIDGGSTATYTYDSEGHRVLNTAGGVNGFIYGIDGNVVADVSGTGGWDTGYVYLGGSLIAQYRDGTTYSIFTDHLGSTRLITRLDKSVYDSLDFMPFGEQSAGDTGTIHKFTGKERDSESGLDNFGARYDSSSMGRFISADDTSAEDNEGDPQGLNLYSYVQDNPINATDPDGHDCVFVSGNKAEVKSGSCSGISGGTYVPGAVDLKSGQYDPNTHTLTFSYTPYEGGSPLLEHIGGVYPTHPYPTEFEKFVSRIAVGNQNVNAFITQVGLETGAGAAGRGIAAGAEAILAARAAKTAAQAAVDLNILSPKIIRQMVSRGWTKQAIVDTIQEAQEAGTTYPAVNRATGGAATEFVSNSTGKFVVVDNATREVFQVSGPGFKPNYLLNKP